jgi:hypothetical protein
MGSHEMSWDVPRLLIRAWPRGIGRYDGTRAST